MGNNRLYIHSGKEAHTLFNRHHILYPEKPFIKIAFNKSLESNVVLQLQIHKNKVIWHRITWMEPLSEEALFALIEKEMDVSICHEYGEVKTVTINPILDLVNNMEVKPSLIPQEDFILDGTSYSLTIGVRERQITCKWDFFPDENHDLQKLADMLEELNEKF